MPKSLVSVPVIKSDHLTVDITLQDMDREHAFSASDVRLLETLAASMSVSLENARLFDETTQRNAELAVINSVQHALAEKLDLQGIYDAVGDKIREIFVAQSILIVSFDHQAEKSINQYFYEKGKKYFPEPIPYTEFQKNMLENGETVAGSDMGIDERVEFAMLGDKPI